MQIYQPVELVFLECPDYDYPGFIVTPKAYWQAQKHLKDDEFEWPGMDQQGFFYLTDSYFEYAGDIEEGKQKLIELGMEHCPELISIAG